MGYFKRQVRRGVARSTRRAFLDAARDIAPADWQRCDPSIQPAPEDFLRFVVEYGELGKHGLFRASNAIESNVELPASARLQLRTVFRWFNVNLPVPRRLPRNAVCWFRSDADDSLQQLRALIEIYQLMGFVVWRQATSNPGRVVYRDAYQVAAVPYADRRTTASVV